MRRTINFTQDLLEKKAPLSFPKTKIVIEVLEDVEPTKEVIAACREFRKAGYILALDDFVFAKKFEPLIKLAHIIKIDFRATPIDEIQKVLYRLRPYNLKFLAEKVETHEEFNLAVKLGFTYFQGFFFGKPEVMQIKDIASAKINLINLLAEVSKKSTSVKQLEKIISSDVGMSYKLLRYINSAYFYLISKIESIKHAIVYLGEEGIRRFVMLVIISEIASDKPDELLRLAVVRAKFCELLAENSSLDTHPSEMFILGLFSLIDAMLDTQMAQLMEKLPINPHIKDALTQQKGPLAPFLQTVITYEKNCEEGCQELLHKLGVNSADVYKMYMEAVEYADNILKM
ncbi:MAG: HDOD domain-containing protein [Desulfobulbaceae bacterium]|uniref:HDOD domain-containing protein n=1 Tax=Candidatus Desulfobia pelagia TaxID=2841692 RepID=A0A8J6NBE2_9BACT|nr:HDOD domain-containing protein [Candidatus Desulfobia pelagia]